MAYGIADLMHAESAYNHALKALGSAHRRYERAVTATARAAEKSDANEIAHAEGMILCARSSLGSAYVDVVDNERRLKVMQASADPRYYYWLDAREHGKFRREFAHMTAEVARLTAEVERLRGGSPSERWVCLECGAIVPDGRCPDCLRCCQLIAAGGDQ